MIDTLFGTIITSPVSQDTVFGMTATHHLYLKTATVYGTTHSTCTQTLLLVHPSHNLFPIIVLHATVT